MDTKIIPYRERLDEIRRGLISNGSLALLLIDVSELAQVEHDYGSSAFEKVLTTASELVLELQGTEVRQNDILTLSDRGGDAFLLFLAPKRGDREGSTRVADLKSAATRVENHLNRRLARLASPYLRGRRRVTVGFSLVFYNPLIMPERLVARLIEEAWEAVRIQRMQLQFQNRMRLQEAMLGEQVTTRFQALVDLRTQGLLGYEALSRGPAGTDHHAPLSLFEAAGECDLVFELDRHCRRKAFESAKGLPVDLKLFVNVYPSSMYDPDFQGTALIEMLGKLGLSPGQIVLEISEKKAIENYALFVEALKNFTDVGFLIAVDDIGAGYSGLEVIARLNPRYLKLDMELIRDIDASFMRREIAQAVKAFADRTGSSVIAEGIERQGELEVVKDLGIEYGQGYLLGRPGESFDYVRPAVVVAPPAIPALPGVPAPPGSLGGGPPAVPPVDSA
jgi:EAL domain-containing protein (putative c-di-GMP-specific phosphodiesterase class I)/GGDEF domain-containing protein